MARSIRDHKLDTRNARRSLKIASKPYWRALYKGLHIGYRKRNSGGSWVVRRLLENGRYNESVLGVADDYQDADGIQTLDYNQALEAARKWNDREFRVERGLETLRKGPYTIADAMNDYLGHYKIEGKSYAATKAASDAHIIPALGDMDVEHLTTKKIGDWHKALAASPARLRTAKNAKKRNIRTESKDSDQARPRRATANRVLTVLKAALNYAWKDGRISNDAAWRKVKPFRNVDAPVIRYLSEAECKRLINGCCEELRPMVQAALFTGCRYGELAALRAHDFNPDAGVVAVRISKSGKPRHAVLTDEGRAFFERAVLGKKGSALIFTKNDGSAWQKSHQSRRLLDACKRAEISPAISFHILRHTHGSLLAMKGVPLPVIAKQLGHADTRMTEKHYAHLAPSYVAETIRENFPTLGIVEEGSVVGMRG